MNSPDTDSPPGAFLQALEELIRERMRNPVADSYVAGLMQAGAQRRAQKVGEEAIELVLAAAAGDTGEQIEEAADLLFHLLVLLNAADIRLADVVAVLERRHRERRAHQAG